MQVTDRGFPVCGRATATLAFLALVVAGAVGGTGNYLIITAEDYAGSAPLTEFANAKAAMGFDVATHTVASGTSRDAIKAYIQSLWGTPDAPDYILIVGDTDGSTAGSNTIPHWTGGGSKHATTDLPYACMDAGDDWYPDIFIGRFPVRSVQMLQDVVDKTLFVEGGNFSDPDYVKRAAFLATNDSTAQAVENHNWVIQNYLDPAGFTTYKIYASQGGGTTQIRDAVNHGVLFTVYFGHSDSSGWWTPSFRQNDVRALYNDGLYGLAMGWSCNTSRFSSDECCGETWIREANKGAAAYLSASDYVWWGSVGAWESSRRMERYFFQSFFEDDIWEVGPAWQEALWRILEDPDFGPTHDHTRNIFEEMVLLGDPALHLPEGDGFSLNPSPLSQEICSPPTVEAAYTIEVRQTGEFNEVVTLSADGLPPAATVDFSVNSLPPPYTSIMTVANLDAGSAGEYNIEITGTATSLTRTTLVGLDISSAVPGPVVLLSPPDGAPEAPRLPTLTWEPSSQALRYDLQVAENPNFVPLMYSATSSAPEHSVAIMLDSATLYYWRVKAINGCGDSGFCAPFSFTTIDQSDYFTEQFGSGFDLDGLTISFYPDGSGDCYDMCGEGTSELPTDPSGGTAINLSDDDYQRIQLDQGRTVELYDVPYAEFFVGSNGYITFGGGDSDYSESLADHFRMPRISLLFDDLNPGSGGDISWKQLDDRAVVTYENVPEYHSSGANTFQVEMFFDGEIRCTWLGIDSDDSVVGLSAGHGVPDDFVETDLSAAGPCYIPGDLNCDGVLDAFDIDPFVLALTNPAGYQQQYPGCDRMLADITGDGVLDAFDVDPFVELLTGP